MPAVSTYQTGTTGAATIRPAYRATHPATGRRTPCPAPHRASRESVAAAHPYPHPHPKETQWPTRTFLPRNCPLLSATT